MKRIILLLITVICISFSQSVLAEELFIGDNYARTDYSAYMRVKVPGDSKGKAMLVFRAKNIDIHGYGLCYYEVGFDTGSKISLRKFYTGYYMTYTKNLKTINVDNDGQEKLITVDAVGNNFKICLDGEEIINYTDNGTYEQSVRMIPVNLTGDIGYHIDGDVQIIDYGSEDYAEDKSHIKSVTVTDENGKVIGEGDYVPPETELNYEIEYTEHYDGLSILKLEDGAGKIIDIDSKEISGNERTGTIISPSDKGYFNVVEFAWDDFNNIQPLYPKGSVAEFNKKSIYDYYSRKNVAVNEKYTIENNMFMTGSSTESVDITFGKDSNVQDVAGLVLALHTDSKLYDVNCYQAVIRNKNTVSLEKVQDGMVTVLDEVSIDTVNNGETHNLKLHIYGSRIIIHYDGEQIMKYLVPDIFYLDGKAGLYSYGENITFGQLVLGD